MKFILPMLALLFIQCLPGQVLGEDFDGTKPLLCATLETFECQPGKQCQERTVQSMDVPQFLRFDFEKKTISGTKQDGTVRTAKIEDQAIMDGKLILQGVQNGRGWSIVVAEDTGKMTLTASDDQAGFVIFGACTPQ